jgi:hypothetical protein
MANIEVKKVEERLNHGLLFSGRVNADEGHTEFPIGIQDQGSATANEPLSSPRRSPSRKNSRQRHGSG